MKYVLIFALWLGLSQAVDAQTVYFSPNCTAAIIKLIDSSQKSIHIQAYSYTSKKISQALIAASKRGVEVIVIVDYNASLGKSCRLAEGLGALKEYTDSKHRIAHNKIMIFDGSTVETGSFNYSYNADACNAENIVVISDPKVAQTYEDEFQVHLKHADAYKVKNATNP